MWRRSFSLSLAFVACALIACAGPVSAALTVEIIQPDADPFTSMVDNPAYFEAVAYIDGQELPGGEVTWDWDFGDQTAHSTDNPTTHTFTEVGEYTVTVTASHEGQQGQDTAIAIVEEPEPSPGGGSISIYVAHDGTWLNYRTQEYEEAEIEDAVAVFIPPEQITDEPEVWAEHQINDPQPPAGWAFYVSVEDEPMELHIIIRDTGDRLGQVVVTNRDTGVLVGTLDANGVGSEIEGRLSVDPTVEAFNLNVKDTEDATLILAGANITQVKIAVPMDLRYAWEPNHGDEHECPIYPGLQGPWGDPRLLDGKRSLEGEGAPANACNGPADFTNDRDRSFTIYGKYTPLLDKECRRDTASGFPRAGLSDVANAAVTSFVETRRGNWDGGVAVTQYLSAPPFSQGTAHIPVVVTGEIHSIFYFPYKGRTKYDGRFNLSLGTALTDNYQHGVDKAAPATAVALNFGWALTPKEVTVAFGAPVAVGDIWGLRCSVPGPPQPDPLAGITAPVTFTLTTDIPGGPISGTGSAEVDTAWTTPSPPPVMYSPLDLTFGEEGTCTVDLAKGWKWKAKGQAGMYYSEGTVGPFNVPPLGTVTLECDLQVLITLKVKTTDPDNQPAEAQVEVYRQDGANWILHSNGDTVEVAGEQVFIASIPLPPGTYKIRAQAKLGLDPPWVETPLFGVTPGIELIKSIQVEPGEMPPPP